MRADQAALLDLCGVFRDFAGLEIELCPAADAACPPWSLAARVDCDGVDGIVAVFTTPVLQEQLARGLVGEPSAAVELDAVRELANVLAGQAYDLVHAGQRPHSFGLPQTLAADEARALWDATTPEDRYLLRDNSGILGCAVISFSSGWTSQWA